MGKQLRSIRTWFCILLIAMFLGCSGQQHPDMGPGYYESLRPGYDIVYYPKIQPGLTLANVEGEIKSWFKVGHLPNGTSSLVAQLTSSNNEIREMLEDPKMQKYFETEAPELNTLLDISTIVAANEVFEKWVAKKVPIIAAVEISINQSYNAIDWAVSYYRIVEAHNINGRVMHAAMSIQKNIDDTYLALRQCQ